MSAGVLVPRILHLTWKSLSLPRVMRRVLASWQRLNPGWDIRLWDDAMIRDLIARCRPEHLARFDAYRQGIQRADMFRYVVLGEIGGVYADLDITALAPAEGLCRGEAGAFVALEPQDHAEKPEVLARGFPFLACNALMGSVPGHPFWARVEAEAWRVAGPGEVMDTTGPYLLTGVMLGLQADERPDLLHPGLWSPETGMGVAAQPFRAAEAVARAGFRLIGGDGAPPLARHAWRHLWWNRRPAVERAVLRLRHHLRGALAERRHGTPDFAPLPPHQPVLHQVLIPAPDRPPVLIAAPMRDAEKFLPGWARLVEKLDYPAKSLSFAFLEGDSRDGTWAALQSLERAWRGQYAEVTLLRRDFGHHPQVPRWDPGVQPIRRANLARCRNMLAAMRGKAEHVLFLDADVTELPPDLLPLMLGSGAPVTMANCLDERGAAYDLNAFAYMRHPAAWWLRHAMKGGIVQPEPGKPRLYMTDVPYLRKMPLDCVGGTCLLVARRVFEAGVVFAETPYRHHLETEGFGLMARDRGFQVLGLPDVRVTHPRHPG